MCRKHVVIGRQCAINEGVGLGILNNRYGRSAFPISEHLKRGGTTSQRLVGHDENEGFGAALRL